MLLNKSKKNKITKFFHHLYLYKKIQKTKQQLIIKFIQKLNLKMNKICN